MNNYGGFDSSFIAMAAAGKNRREIKRLEEEMLVEKERQRLFREKQDQQAQLRAQTPVVIMYRRQDGSEASVSCAQADYARQITRIEQRGYTILNIVK